MKNKNENILEDNELIPEQKPNDFTLVREMVRIGDLTLTDYNPKKYEQKSANVLDESIETFGHLKPFLVNRRTGNILDGNQRTKRELKRGDSEKLVPVDYIDVSPYTEKLVLLTLS